MLEALIVVAIFGGAVIGSFIGSLAHRELESWRVRRDLARERARIEDIRRRVRELRDAKRAAGEPGMVLVDTETGKIEWMPAAVSVIGPEGRA